MRCPAIGFLMWVALASPVHSQPAPKTTLVPDRDTVVKLVSVVKGFEFMRSSRGVTVQPVDPLPDGRVPVVLLALVPSDRKREGWEQELDLLENKIELLQARQAQAEGEQEYQLAKQADEARKEAEFIRQRARADGKKMDLPDFKAVELGIAVLKKQGEWTLSQALKLGRFDEDKLGAFPADAELQTRVRDFNHNGLSELKLSVLIDLHLPQLAGSATRIHNYHFLLEFWPRGARVTFQLDGGVDSGGMCEDPLDGMSVAKFWINSPRRSPAVLSVGRTRSMCERGTDPLKDLPAFQRYAWSDKHLRWQEFGKIKPDAFLVVAAADRDRQPVERVYKILKRRNIRRRGGLRRPYPLIVTSDDFPGLKAGSHLLVLGSCPDAQRANKALRKIRKRFRGKGMSWSVRGYQKKGAPRLTDTCPRPR